MKLPQVEVIDKTIEMKKKTAERLEQTTASLKQKRTAEEFINLNDRLTALHNESNALRSAKSPSPAPAPAPVPMDEGDITEEEGNDYLLDDDADFNAAAEEADAEQEEADAEEEAAAPPPPPPAKKQRKKKQPSLIINDSPTGALAADLNAMEVNLSAYSNRWRLLALLALIMLTEMTGRTIWMCLLM